MLHLALHTPLDWPERAVQSMDVILLDHCHLEKKAASTALNLIFRYPEYPQLAKPLSELAREELTHFELMLEHLAERSISYQRLKPSPYPGKLMKCVRLAEPERLLDTLMVCAFIEARSCERMGLLGDVLDDVRLRELYRDLLVSEARHHSLYLDLARLLFGRTKMEARMEEVALYEAEVMREMPKEPRLHNG
ncbi:MAG: tRNA-(ms[2]io[6]A)-hydroxylase [Myxococcales bacterium]|nr:tRNA-(ms[2]io[6]A)-hydroxylase [Myxococcales bacterium]